MLPTIKTWIILFKSSCYRNSDQKMPLWELACSIMLQSSVRNAETKGSRLSSQSKKVKLDFLSCLELDLFHSKVAQIGICSLLRGMEEFFGFENSLWVFFLLPYIGFKNSLWVFVLLPYIGFKNSLWVFVPLPLTLKKICNVIHSIVREQPI